MIITEEDVNYVTGKPHTKSFPSNSPVFPDVVIDVNKLIVVSRSIKPQYLSFTKIIQPDKARSAGYSPKRQDGASIRYPILVTPTPNGKYMIVDGRHRYWKNKEVGRERLRVRIVLPKHIYTSVISKHDVAKMHKGKHDGAKIESVTMFALGALSGALVARAVKPIIKSITKYYQIKYARHRIDLKAYKIMVHNTIRRALVGAAKYSNTVQFYTIQNHIILALYANINKIIQDNNKFNSALYNSLEFIVDYAIANKPITPNDILKMVQYLKSLAESLQETKRDYKKEYEEYHSKPDQRANRSKRVLARRKLMKQGRVKKGDGKDVDHKDGNPQNNSAKNLRCVPKKSNRGTLRVNKQ